MTLTDRFAGCLFGLALGDALGAPVEAAAPDVVARHVALIRNRDWSRLPGRERFPFGQVTDDTQLARLLLLSIFEAESFRPERFAARLLELATGPGFVGGGHATRSAVRALSGGAPWNEGGVPAPYAGNGAAMRSGPLGFLFGKDLDRLKEVVALQSRVTHHDSRAAAAALVVAGAVSIWSRPGEIDWTRSLLALAELARPVDSPVADAVADLEGWRHLPPVEAIRSLSERGLEPEGGGEWQGVSGFAVSSVCWSLYGALRAPDDYLEAITSVMAAGGDTDTVAAMTGAIVGARVGTAGLPMDLVRRVHDRDQWDWAELERLAERAARWAEEQGLEL